MDGSHDDFLFARGSRSGGSGAGRLACDRRQRGDGEQGRDGRGYTGSSAPRGQDGRHGDDAGPPERGQAAGDIELMLREAAGEQRVELSGRKCLPAGHEQVIRETIDIGELGAIRLSSCGGGGGDGGRGGDGEAGRQGTRWYGCHAMVGRWRWRIGGRRR